MLEGGCYLTGLWAARGAARVTGNPRNRIEGDSPLNGKGHTVCAAGVSSLPTASVRASAAVDQLSEEAVLFGRGRPHREFAGWHDNHLRAVGAFLERRVSRLQRAFVRCREDMAAHVGEPVDVVLQRLFVAPGGQARDYRRNREF
jgi:hypothetical protein